MKIDKGNLILVLLFISLVLFIVLVSVFLPPNISHVKPFPDWLKRLLETYPAWS